ncbi:replication protein [Pantoea sp. B9002]|uniref:replication protein n=1 Tax=Pantoea sp. B9002 TaxID=2726979 RepID=UPI0015A07560|nr:replication protein [Pantoea sp. B9002]NWA63007.1 replication protein [Pantoea sp. B9002]
MENQKHGYIPLYRSVKKQPWAKDVFLRTLWENLLIDAARQPYTANYKGHRWPLEIGQLVTTSADLGMALCDRNGEPTSRHSVERMLAFFEKEEMISVVAERRKGTLITVLNYAEYAEKIGSTPAHMPAHMPAHSEASNTKASESAPAHIGEHKAAHHEQEYINNNKNLSSSRNSIESPDDATKRFLSRHPEAANGVYTAAGKSWGTAEDLKAAQWIHSKIRMVDATAAEPNWPEWANTVRLMRQQDERSHHDICDLFRWANKHHFWAGNILSPGSLRKQWGTLTAQRNTDRPTSKSSASKLDFDNTDWAEGLQI